MLYSNRDNARAALGRYWRWPHFSVAELACRCGGRFCAGAYWHDPNFLDGLEDMRARIGRPIQVNSGHRCAQWNAAVGGAALSQHKRLAVDISLHKQDRQLVLTAAQVAGFRGLGLARTFLHVDRRPLPAMWFYKGSKELWQI